MAPIRRKGCYKGEKPEQLLIRISELVRMVTALERESDERKVKFHKELEKKDALIAELKAKLHHYDQARPPSTTIVGLSGEKARRVQASLLYNIYNIFQFLTRREIEISRSVSQRLNSAILNWPKKSVALPYKKRVFKSEQVQGLEEGFKWRRYLNAQQRQELADSLKLSDLQVRTWFQKRRHKDRLAKQRYWRNFHP